MSLEGLAECGEGFVGPRDSRDNGGRPRADVTGKERDGAAVGWDDHLSEKTALAIQATMWALATDRERSAVYMAVSRDGYGGIVDVGSSCGLGGRGGKRSDEEGGSVAAAATRDIGVSLPRASRYVKACPLIDGVRVLEADVDLEFKRWEETGRTREEVASAAAAAADSELALRQKRCEAVGCSEIARYGDIRPMAEARLCRRHRSNGMADVGGRR